MKKILLLIAIISLKSIVFGQGNPNLIPNGSFELSGTAPSLATNDFNSDVNWWDVAQYDGDGCTDSHGSEFHPCSIADYVNVATDNSYIDGNSCSSPVYPSDRFVILQSGSIRYLVPFPGYCHHSTGIRVQLIKDGAPYSLIQGHTYKLKLKLRLGSANSSNLYDNLRVHFSYFGENWNANPNLSVNRKWSNATSFQYDPLDYDPCTWYSFERTFVVPSDCDGSGGCDYLQNMILFLDDNESEEVSAGLCIDDVELYDEGCCIPYKQYENTSDLPSLTQTSDYIKAGNDAGIPSTSGNVTVLSGQNVTFKAGNTVILEPGFNVQTGAIFNAIIEDCNSSTLSTGDINVPFVPNVFTPNGDGINDNYCLNVTGANQYHIQIFDRWGTLRFDYLDFIYSSFVCMWDGRCNQGFPNCSSSTVPEDVYFYIITLFNCTNSVEYTGNLNIFRGYTPNDDPELNDTLSGISELTIFPNPNDGSFQISIIDKDGEIEIKELEIYNIMGKLIYKNNSNIGKVEVISIEDYADGIYYIRSLDINGEIKMKKLIKQ